MDLRQLVRAFDGGRIDADTLVWRKGMPDWRRLRDVPELAERLMGPEAAAKAATAEAPLEAGPGASELPPQFHDAAPQNQNRAERSRTPPANYSIDDRAQGMDPRWSESERKEATPSSEAAATMPGASAVPQTPPGGYGSPEPLRAKPGDRRSTSAASSRRDPEGTGFGAVPAAPRLNPGSPVISAKSGSTQMGLSAAGLTPAPAEQRTITQTGLAPAPEPGARASLSGNSVLEPAAGARASDADAEGARGSAAAPSPSPRNSRSPTPAPGARRRPSSDETPAQKPASISVSSSALAQAAARPRGKPLVALGALVLVAGAVMVHETRPTDAPVIGPAAAPERQPPVGASELPRIEKSAPLPLEPVPEPKPATPQAITPSAPTPALAPAPTSAAKAAPADPMAENPARLAHSPVTPAAAGAAAHAPSKPAPALDLAASAPRIEIHPSVPESPVPPSAEPPVTGRAEIAAPAAPPPAPAREPAAASPAVPAPAVVPRTATPPAAALPPATVPPATVPPATVPPATVPPATVPPATPAPGTATPAVFDEKRAREQMGLAAFKASTCNQLGGTRGSGQVNVVIQSWGRVVRVTHLNQAFVGTPVGLCIMEAFQQVQVPPFEGGPRTLVGSFLVQ
jgi:hypothetical protein